MHATIAQRGEHQIQFAEVPGSMFTWVRFSYWIFFCFHIVKPMMSVLPLWPIYAKTQFAKKLEFFYECHMCGNIGYNLIHPNNKIIFSKESLPLTLRSNTQPGEKQREAYGQPIWAIAPPLSLKRMTDTDENITFPRNSYAVGKNTQLYHC